MPLAELSHRAQLKSLRSIAAEMLAQYDGGPFTFRVLLHAFNCTFRVASRDGSRYALRVNVNSHRLPEELAFETAWTDALSRESGFVVARPSRNRLGSFVTEVERPNRTFRGVLYQWLPGPNLGHAIKPFQAEALGKATRRLHEQAAAWTPPSGCTVRPFADAIAGEPFPAEPCAGVDYAPMFEVVERANALFARFEPQPKIAVHNDLHYDNLKWHQGRLAIFDFDDCAMSWPVTDCFITSFYLRRFDPSVEAAYWQGYGLGPTDFGIDEIEFETLVASRSVLLSNAMFNATTPSLRNIAEPYAKVCERRLVHFLKTGRFDPTVANLT